MRFYFETPNIPYRGKRITTLPITLRNDLKRADEIMAFETLNDLQALKDIALNRKEWQAMSAYIKKKATENKQREHQNRKEKETKRKAEAAKSVDIAGARL